MDFKKLASDAGTFFNRAKQYTEEKLGNAEKTELDAHFENLLHRADTTREWTERIISQTETVLQPSPNVRMEEFFYEKIDGKKRERVTNTETLGQYMMDAGNEFGPGTSYGSALVKVGQTEQKVGSAEKEFIYSTSNNFLQPLKAFLDGDMKTLQKERRSLESKRLDLDAAKSRLRRAKSVSGTTQGSGPIPQNQDVELTQPNGFSDNESIARCEADLRKSQAEFDRQAEITKLLLEGISSAHSHHLRCLHDFVEAQTTYYAQCQQYMADLTRQLGSYTLGGSNVNPIVNDSISPDIHPPSYTHATQNSNNEINSQRAKVLYDYDSADMSELSLKADEIITVSSVPGKPDWLFGERGSQTGRVPAPYLQILQ